MQPFFYVTDDLFEVAHLVSMHNKPMIIKSDDWVRTYKFHNTRELQRDVKNYIKSLRLFNPKNFMSAYNDLKSDPDTIPFINL